MCVWASDCNSCYDSVFETTIRYLGGFLSAYELDDFKNPILLQKAQEVADKMAFAWHEVFLDSCSRLQSY